MKATKAMQRVLHNEGVINNAVVVEISPLQPMQSPLLRNWTAGPI
jgi:hypothetical protein